MCTTLLTAEETLSPFAGKTRWQDTNFKPAEHIEERTQPLTMRWVVVIDHQGDPRLRMRWTVELLPTLGKGTLLYLGPTQDQGAIQLPSRRHE